MLFVTYITSKVHTILALITDECSSRNFNEPVNVSLKRADITPMQCSF